MEITFRDLKFSDSVAVNSLLKSTGNTDRHSLVTLVKSIDDKDSSAFIMESTKGKEILGVWLSTRFEKHISITFFYILPEVRRKLAVFDFFKFCITNVNPDYSVPMYIRANDVSTFKKYVVAVEGEEDLYRFVGFKNRRAGG